MVEILADAPELLALAGLASVPASKTAAAFNDPENFFEYLTLEQLARLRGAVERLGALSQAMVAAVEVYAKHARAVLDEAQGAESAD